MKDLQGKFGLTYIFISHNLSVVKHLCDRIGVIYLGNLVELAGKEELFKNMLHPYTQALISAIPIPDPSLEREKILLEGDVPTPINPPKGCPFATRCMYAAELCKRERPGLEDVAEAIACLPYIRRRQGGDEKADGGERNCSAPEGRNSLDMQIEHSPPEFACRWGRRLIKRKEALR